MAPMDDMDTTPDSAPQAVSAAPGQDPAGNVDLGLLSNVSVHMTVEVGNAQITLQDLLRLNEGSVVELDRMAGDPLDILINGTQIAKGEVVVVGEKFGIRFGDIVDPKKRFETV